MQMKFIRSTSDTGLSMSVNQALDQGFEFVEMQMCAEQPSANSYSSGDVYMVAVLRKD